MPEATDQTARDKASEALHAVRNLAMTTQGEFRLVNQKLDASHTDTNTKIERVESAIKWAGGLVISLMLTVLGWSVVQQINANESQKKEMAQQIELLRQQEATRNAARAEILSRLPPRAAEPADAADGLGQ